MTLIKNGTIIDGQGTLAFVGDVLVEDDRIVEVIPAGELQNFKISAPRNLIDASGLIV